MLEKSRKTYLKSKSVRRKYIIKALFIFIVILIASIIVSILFRIEMLIPLTVVFAGLGSYTYYNVKTDGYKERYYKYFADLKSELIKEEKIVIIDYATDQLTEDEIEESFNDFKNHQINTSNYIQVIVDDVKMQLVHTKVLNLLEAKIETQFEGTIIALDNDSDRQFRFDKDTLETEIENPSFLKRIRDAFGEDVIIVQKKEMLYIATKRVIPINHYVYETFRRTIRIPVFHYDDLDKVINSWRYFKVLKNIILN